VKINREKCLRESRVIVRNVDIKIKLTEIRIRYSSVKLAENFGL